MDRPETITAYICRHTYGDDLYVFQTIDNDTGFYPLARVEIPLTDACFPSDEEVARLSRLAEINRTEHMLSEARKTVSDHLQRLKELTAIEAPSDE